MIPDSPLIVPITVEALAVNEINRIPSHDIDYTWNLEQINYGLLQNANAIWPPVPNTEISTSTNPSFYDGIYVKWRLPAAFTRGFSDGSNVTLPVVPNRWLVVRYAAATAGGPRTATAWVIESDATNLTSNAKSYSDLGSSWVASPPRPGDYPIGTAIGRNVQLVAGQVWSEPPAAPAPFLTAVAPGNPAFAVFQPFCNNVFSFFDPLLLSDVPPQPISYCVIGWYSDLVYDPLAGGGSSPLAMDDVLAALDWTIAAADGTTTSPGDVMATWSLYSGFVTGVEWQTELPFGSAAPVPPIGVAVGPTSVQALTNLITLQAGDDPGIQAELLAALQLNALHVLDEPNGQIELDELIEASSFQKSYGGTSWTLKPGGSPPAVLTPLESAALDELNVLQSELDAAGRTLAGLRTRLYTLWFRYFFLTTPGNENASLKKAIAAELEVNPSDLSSTAAGQVAAQQAGIATLAGAVGDLAAALSDVPDFSLLSGAKPAFYAPNEPVMLLSRAGASGIVGNSPLPLPCRFPSQLVSGFTCSGTEIVAEAPPLPCGSPWPAPPTDAVAVQVPMPPICTMQSVPWSPELVAALLAELYFLDPFNATEIANDPSLSGLTQSEIAAAMSDPAANATGTLPNGFFFAGSPPEQLWQTNPWHPIFLSWSGYFALMPFSPGWEFTLEGYTTSLSGAPPDAPQIPVSGQTILTAAAAVNFQAQIENLLAAEKYHGSPGSPHSFLAELHGLAELLQFVQSQDQWDLVSQTLEGFNEQLLLLTNGGFLGPAALPVYTGSPSLAQLIGTAAGYPPQPNPTAPFQLLRSGELTLESLVLIDEWGQTLTLLDTTEQGSDTFPITPPQPSTLLFQPAVLQPARLNFTLLGQDPIRGWIVPNLLDQSLLVYDAAGNALGELLIGGDDTPCWNPFESGSPPHSPSFGDASFRSFIEALLVLSAQTFSSFIDALDVAAQNIVTTDASYNQALSLLVGRPLAFIRASLEYELDGPARFTSTLDATLSSPPQPPPITLMTFPIGLGNPDQTEDGLIGYFADADFSAFNVVVSEFSSPGDPWLQPAGANGNWLNLRFGEPPAVVSMLSDPRLPVHAITNILPVESVQVPPSDVTAALRRMNVAFRVNTILTDQPAPGVVAMPLPTTQGTWSWVETPDGIPQSWAVAPVNPNALLSGQPPVLRRGFLELQSPFSSIGSPNERS